VARLWDSRSSESCSATVSLPPRSDTRTLTLTDIEVKIEDHLGSSVFALAATLIVTIGDEAVPRLHRAALAAIRPLLVGAIAEDTDRVLAENEEVA
jgi:hypothetical protein